MSPYLTKEISLQLASRSSILRTATPLAFFIKEGAVLQNEKVVLASNPLQPYKRVRTGPTEWIAVRIVTDRMNRQELLDIIPRWPSIRDNPDVYLDVDPLGAGRVNRPVCVDLRSGAVSELMGKGCLSNGAVLHFYEGALPRAGGKDTPPLPFLPINDGSGALKPPIIVDKHAPPNDLIEDSAADLTAVFGILGGVGLMVVGIGVAVGVRWYRFKGRVYTSKGWHIVTSASAPSKERRASLNTSSSSRRNSSSSNSDDAASKWKRFIPFQHRPDTSKIAPAPAVDLLTVTSPPPATAVSLASLSTPTSYGTSTTNTGGGSLNAAAAAALASVGDSCKHDQNQSPANSLNASSGTNAIKRGARDSISRSPQPSEVSHASSHGNSNTTRRKSTSQKGPRPPPITTEDYPEPPVVRSRLGSAGRNLEVPRVGQRSWDRDEREAAGFERGSTSFDGGHGMPIHPTSARNVPPNSQSQTNHHHHPVSPYTSSGRVGSVTLPAAKSTSYSPRLPKTNLPPPTSPPHTSRANPSPRRASLGSHSSAKPRAAKNRQYPNREYPHQQRRSSTNAAVTPGAVLSASNQQQHQQYPSRTGSSCHSTAPQDGSRNNVICFGFVLPKELARWFVFCKL